MLKEYLISLEWNVLIGFLFQYSIKKFLTRIWIRYRYTDIKRPGSRTKKLTKRHPRNKINSTKKHFPPRRDEPEVRGERTGGRWVAVGDCLQCRGVVWRGPWIQSYIDNLDETSWKSCCIIFHSTLNIIILKSSAEVFIYIHKMNNIDLHNHN